ncbi:MAG: hypothetical protein HRU38_13745 [Saccharospirillaceae bacterium]|nr:hypothetical protein [Pseudomonadales bacterium]NRB79708.1 hypothetical protein [Saccharospirillaceae bacterium]
MLKVVVTCLISILVFSSCNTTAQFQKSFDNNQGVLVIPLKYLKKSNTPDNIAQLINHKLSLVIVNVGTKQKITKSVTMSLNNKYVVSNGFAPGSYEVVKSYYLKGVVKEHVSDESIMFTIKPGEFNVLPDALNFSVYQDNAGKYWLTKRFVKIKYSESKKLKETLESMMPSTAVE